MTARGKTSPRPTDGELEILRVLWEKGPSTVREVHEALEEDRRTGYTTVLKLLQIMTEKGLVRRDERERAHVYEARSPREETERVLVGDLLERAFAGSASALVLRALSSKRATAAELAQIVRRVTGRVQAIDDPIDAVRQACASGRTVVVTGSIFLIGPVRAWLARDILRSS